MRAIAVVPGTKTIRMVERPRPSIGAPDEIELRVLRVGICGTDREEAAGGRAKAPPGHDDLVLGHEMIGQVTAVGAAVTMVAPGDCAVFTVRRGCGRCRACAMNRSDMCRTGAYAERGIWGLDGYQTEFVVDRESKAQYREVGLGAEVDGARVITKGVKAGDRVILDGLQRLGPGVPVAARTYRQQTASN